MKQFLISLVLTLQFAIHYSQKSYVFPENFNKYYNFDPDGAYDQLKKLNLKNKEGDIDNYVVDYIYSEQYVFDANKVYLDWPEYELYLVKILNTVVPENAEKKKMDVFIERTSVRNAGASGFGNIYFNLGMLNYAEDEAYLAEVFAHEGAHILYGHRDKKLAYKQRMVASGKVDQSMYDGYLKMGQIYETQADSFALEALKKHKLSFESLLTDYDDAEMRKQIENNSVSFSKLAKASNLDPASLSKKKQKDKKPYASHPSTVERIDKAKKVKDACLDCSKRYFIDSALFHKFKKTAQEECKKIAFESCKYDECIRICFREYLANPKNLKNLYYIIESIRRLLYIDPKLSKTGFLTQYIDDSDLYYETKSVLYKPDYIFETFKQYEALKNNALFTKQQKPFNTYKEAFFYFSNEALKYNFNEANLSLGLYYHVQEKPDSCQYYLTKYTGGAGLNTEFALNFLKTQRPSIDKGKTLIVYDNVGNYNLSYSYIGYYMYEFHDMNYYLTKKRKKYNKEIRTSLLKDSSKSDLIIVNELLGAKPFKLYEMQKLSSLISHLYTEDDVEMCKKARLTSNYIWEKNNVSNVFRKHLLVMAPEWYSWMKTNGYDKLFYVDVVYEYRGPVNENESYNTYTGHYLDMNQTRPFFKDAVRIANNRKQKESEICKDLYSFLYE